MHHGDGGLTRLKPQQRAQVRAAVATWSPLTEAAAAQVAALFEPYQALLMGAGKHPYQPS